MANAKEKVEAPVVEKAADLAEVSPRVAAAQAADTAQSLVERVDVLETHVQILTDYLRDLGDKGHRPEDLP